MGHDIMLKRWTANEKRCQEAIAVAEEWRAVALLPDHLHANCRLALRVRMEPHVLKAVHWYTPVSWSLSSSLMIRLPPDM